MNELFIDSLRELNYDNLEYGHIQQIKTIIRSLAKVKNIPVILPD